MVSYGNGAVGGLFLSHRMFRLATLGRVHAKCSCLQTCSVVTRANPPDRGTPDIALYPSPQMDGPMSNIRPVYPTLVCAFVLYVRYSNVTA